MSSPFSALTTLLLMSWSLTWTEAQQCGCRDLGSPQAYICDDPLLTAIPDCVPSGIMSLTIQSPVPLAAGTIDRFNSLVEIIIMNRSIQNIEKFFFGDNGSVLFVSFYLTDLDFLDKNIFLNASQIQAVALSNNKFTTLSEDTFSYLPELKSVFLDGNQLTTLTVGIFDNTTLSMITMDNNPWHCDCQMANFMQYTRNQNIYVSENATCWQPFELRGLNLLQLTEEQVC